MKDVCQVVNRSFLYSLSVEHEFHSFLWSVSKFSYQIFMKTQFRDKFYLFIKT